MEQQQLFKLVTPYADLLEEIKSLQERKKIMEEQIMSEMKSMQLMEIETPAGTACIKIRKVWEYSPELEQKMKDVRMLKKESQKNGSAAIVDTKETLKLEF